MKPKLVLLPNLLFEDLSIKDFFPENLSHEIEKLDGLIAESEKNARRYLCKFLSKERANALRIFLLNEHTKSQEIDQFFKDFKGYWGLISDSGMPCIADPGSKIVALCHTKGFLVNIICGPSSILIALLISGFDAHKFTFHGYLPKDLDVSKIKKIEKDALLGYTQIFIEAPYRSDKLLNLLLNSLNDESYLSIASSLTSPDQRIITAKVKKLKESNISLGKNPTIFLIAKNLSL